MSVDTQVRTAPSGDTMLPYRVVGRTPQTPDTVTLHLEPVRDAAQRFRAGQFMMLYSFGVGEVAISISRTLRPATIAWSTRSGWSARSAAHCTTPISAA